MSQKIKITLLVTGIVFIAVISTSMVFQNLATWQGWDVISSISTLIAGLGVFVIAYQFLLQKKEYDLGQIEFLLNLSSDFYDSKEKYGYAWNILRDYPKVPEQMPEEEWNHVVNALQRCYQSAHFNYKIAKLLEKGIIEPENLYLLHYNEIIDHADGRISFLLHWCDSGLDLAAGYDKEELLRINEHTGNMCLKMFELDKKHDGSGYKYMKRNFEDYEERLTKLIEKEKFSEKHVEITDDNYA